MGAVGTVEGYGGYGVRVRWVRWRDMVGTVEGYGGYGGGVWWVRWKGTTVGTVEGMGNVDGHSACRGGCTEVRGDGASTVQGRRGEIYITSSSSNTAHIYYYSSFCGINRSLKGQHGALAVACDLCHTVGKQSTLTSLTCSSHGLQRLQVQKLAF